MSLRMHKRYPITTRARYDLEPKVWEIIKEHDLTYLEALKALTGIMETLTMYAIRGERHPADDCDYKGDEQCSNPVCRGEDPDHSVFIQWKGTDLCCDLRCSCGHHSHFDGDFAHVLKCPKCGLLWEMPTDVYPVEIDETDRTPLEANPE